MTWVHFWCLRCTAVRLERLQLLERENAELKQENLLLKEQLWRR